MANPRQNNPYLPDPTYDAINIKSYGAVALKDASDAINSAIAAINNSPTAKGTIYFPPGTYTVSNSVTVPAGVHLIFERGAILSIASGKTLTIAGTFDAPLSQIFSGSGTVSITGQYEQIIPQWWGATGDGTTDDTTAINAAITAANISTATTKGRIVFFPAGNYNTTSQLTTPARYVTLRGASTWARSGTGSNTSTITTTLTTTPMFDLGNNTTGAVTFEDLRLTGQSAGTKNAHAVYSASCSQLKFYRMRIDTFGGSAISIQGGTGLYIRDLFIDRCNKDYANFSTYQGALDIACGESTVEEAEIAGGLAATTHGAAGSGYMCCVVVRNSPHRFHKVVAEFGQTGWYFTTGTGGDYIFLTDCRSEGNQREGYLLAGGRVMFSNCTAMNNSQDTNNTYDGWSFASTSRGNVLVNCLVGGTGGASYQQRYGFSDAAAAAADNLAFGNRYVNCAAPFNINGRTFNITGVIKPTISPLSKMQSLSGTGTQTFSGEGGDLWVLTVNANTATTITANNLLPGHTYYLYIIQHSGAPTITLDTVFAKTATFTSPAASKQLSGTFRSDGTSLYQIGNWSGDM